LKKPLNFQKATNRKNASPSMKNFKSNIPNIPNQVVAIKYFIEKMDIEMIDAFLDNDKKYQDLEKSEFISKLDKAFDEFKAFGDTQLISVLGRCRKCDTRKSGYTFIGNNSRMFMSIIFDTERYRIKDLYECTSFRNSKYKLNLSKRIYIDLYGFLSDIEFNEDDIPF
jgi:hypothetical protein